MWWDFAVARRGIGVQPATSGERERAGPVTPSHLLRGGSAQVIRMNVHEAIAAGDVSVFKVGSQSTMNGKRSLLMLQHLVACSHPGYVYLEIGSHIGGTLFPHLVDERCGAAFSIDPRPEGQPDERGRIFTYGKANTTRRMLAALKEAGAPTAKLRTFESDISAVDLNSVRGNVRLALIDGEHTNRAAFRDFCRTLKIVENDAIIAFHDSAILIDALISIEPFMDYIDKRCRLFALPDGVFAVALGEMAGPAATLLGPQSRDLEEHYAAAKVWLRKAIIESDNAPLWDRIKRSSFKSLRQLGLFRPASSRARN
jgi:hypothetical protein